MPEILLVIPGAVVVAGAVYSFLRPRDHDDVAVLESARGSRSDTE